MEKSMNPMPAWLALTCRLLLIALVPVALTLTNVRLLMTPLFPNFEYNLPGFPLDLYGFTKEDRLKWSKVAIDYLLNNAGIEFLADLRFPEGQTAPLESCGDYTTRDCTYLYNDRELRHMVDVKNVTRGAAGRARVGRGDHARLLRGHHPVHRRQFQLALRPVPPGFLRKRHLAVPVV